jgi:hypothetical protein
VTNFPALDVAIGLSFVYFVLSLVCSALNESVAAITARRAKFLREGLRTLLDADHGPPSGALRQLYDHPLIKNMTRKPERFGRRLRERYPSYLPSRTFAAALLDFPKDGKVDPQRSLADSIAAVQNAEVRRALEALLRAGGDDAASFRHRVEQWYDDAMERVSGWYRRRVQIWLWAFAILVSVLLNADTLMVGETLWTRPATRAAVVAAAQKAVDQGASSESSSQQAVQRVKDLERTNLPLGWHFGKGSKNDPRKVPGPFTAWAAKLLGLLLTASALTLGAPFWFDALSRIARIRSSGAPPPASDAVRRGDAEQARAGSGAAAVA